MKTIEDVLEKLLSILNKAPKHVFGEIGIKLSLDSFETLHSQRPTEYNYWCLLELCQIVVNSLVDEMELNP